MLVDGVAATWTMKHVSRVAAPDRFGQTGIHAFALAPTLIVLVRRWTAPVGRNVVVARPE